MNGKPRDHYWPMPGNSLTQISVGQNVFYNVHSTLYVNEIKTVLKMLKLDHPS